MIRFFFSHSDDGTENQRLTGAKILPNVLTIAALCIGLTALRYGVDFRWTKAMQLVLIAAVLDGMDGMVARLLKASSRFGAELDSLSDFVSFGVVPSVLLYQWNLRDAGPFGWVASLLLCVAVALRLARFNVKNAATGNGASGDTSGQKSFFEGVPAPAGAILALVPMMLGFKICSDDQDCSLYPPLVAIWVIFIAALMVSRIPTYSLKRLKLRQKHMIPLLTGVAFLIAALASEFWLTIIIISLLYMATIPHAVKRYQALYEMPFVQTMPAKATDDAVPPTMSTVVDAENDQTPNLG